MLSNWSDSNGVIIYLLNQVDVVCKDFVFHGYQNLVAVYSPAIYGLIILSIIIFGYITLQGIVQFSLSEVSRRALMIGFVIALAMNWGNFSTYVYNLFTIAPNEIAEHVIEAIPGVAFGTNGVNGALDQAWSTGIGFVIATWQKGSVLHNWFPYLWGFLMLLVLLILVGIALIELVIAKFGIAIYLVLAPLMIPLFLFKATKEAVFDGWLRHLITFAFIPIFITSALALGLMLMSHTVTKIQDTIHTSTLTVTDLAPYLIYSLVCIGLLIKAAFMAASMGGGMATGVAQHLANTAGNFRRYFSERRARRTPDSGSNNSMNFHYLGNSQDKSSESHS